MMFYLPPLRENRTLLPALANEFIEKYAQRDSRPVEGLLPEALQMLQKHNWPGNIRELRNVIERAVALSHGAWIGPNDLPDSLRSVMVALPVAQPGAEESISRVTLAMRKQETEEQVIRHALQRNRNNKLRTASELGVSRMTLYKKLYQYGLMEAVASA
jgi:two-component system, NtrC family, response regulator AtoC